MCRSATIANVPPSRRSGALTVLLPSVLGVVRGVMNTGTAPSQWLGTVVVVLLVVLGPSTASMPSSTC
jgi:hypothetical protein